MSAKYTLFRADGVPLRATATISLEEIPAPEEGQNPTSGSLNSRRSHLVGDGDTLHSIAYDEYVEIKSLDQLEKLVEKHLGVTL